MTVTERMMTDIEQNEIKQFDEKMEQFRKESLQFNKKCDKLKVTMVQIRNDKYAWFKFADHTCGIYDVSKNDWECKKTFKDTKTSKAMDKADEYWNKYCERGLK